MQLFADYRPLNDVSFDENSPPARLRDVVPSEVSLEKPGPFALYGEETQDGHPVYGEVVRGKHLTDGTQEEDKKDKIFKLEYKRVEPKDEKRGWFRSACLAIIAVLIPSSLAYRLL